MRVLKEFLSDAKYADLTIGEMLSHYMLENNISESGLATILNINRKTLKLILQGEDCKVSHAIRIARLLDISSKSLLEGFLLQAKEDEEVYLDYAKKVAFLLDNFDLAELKASKVISSVNEYNKIEEELCGYFGYKNIIEYADFTIKAPLFSKSNMAVNPTKEKVMQDFWVKSNIESFRKINNPNEFNKELLFEFLKRIKSFTKDIEVGFSEVQLVLFQLGITVIVQSYITKTKAYGMTMIVNDKPCIVITDMGKQYYKLWFTLLHELYHVIEDYDYLKTTSYHISDLENRDLFVSEDNADAFAREIFVPKDKMEILDSLINNSAKINQLAKSLDMHPSMLYGVYLDSANKSVQTRDFPRFAKYLPSSTAALKNIVFDAVGRRSIDAAVLEMKKKLNLLTA